MFLSGFDWNLRIQFGYQCGCYHKYVFLRPFMDMLFDVVFLKWWNKKAICSHKNLRWKTWRCLIPKSLMKAFDSIDMLNKCVVDLNLVRQVNFKVWLHCSHIGERVEMADKVRIFWWVVRAKGILRLTICTNWIWSGWLSMKLKLDLNGYHEKNLDARLKKLGIYGYSDLSFWYLWTLDVFCGINWLK